MKHLLLTIALITSLSAIAQDPVAWTFEYVQDADSGTVVLSARIDEGWHVYGLKLENDLGPLPTVITFDEADVNWGDLQVPVPKEKYDDMFVMNVSYYETEVTFTRNFSGSFEKISGNVEFMVCNDEMCLPPTTIPFELVSFEGR